MLWCIFKKTSRFYLFKINEINNKGASHFSCLFYYLRNFYIISFFYFAFLTEATITRVFILLLSQTLHFQFSIFHFPFSIINYPHLPRHHTINQTGFIFLQLLNFSFFERNGLIDFINFFV